MIEDSKIQNLADTLNKSGLAASPSEAIRMAKNILGTEQRVAKDFDVKNEEINDGLERKKTYEEEINDLIEKTSPEHKDFHIPIKGYTKDTVSNASIPNIMPNTELKVEEPKIEASDNAPLEDETELKTSEESKASEKTDEEVQTQSSEEEIAENYNPKQTDSVKNELDDSRPLNEVLAEPDVYENSKSKEPQTVVTNSAPGVNIPSEALEEEEENEVTYNLVNVEYGNSVDSEKDSNEDFIVDVPATANTDQSPQAAAGLVQENQFSESVATNVSAHNAGDTPNQAVPVSEPVLAETQNIKTNQPEQQNKMFAEIKEQKSANKDYKNPIPKVDLMDYFNFT